MKRRIYIILKYVTSAGIAQLGERQTEDLKVTCSIHVHRNQFFLFIFMST